MKVLLNSFMIGLFTLLLAGCATAGSGKSATGNGKGTTVQAIDDCANRLHDLEGMILHYYLLNGKMPPSLDAVLPLADPLMELPGIVCPVSKKSYIYSQEGYKTTGDDRLLIVYDPEPVHGGCYRGIVMYPPVAHQPLSLSLVLLPPEALRAYVSSASAK